ncbi:MAG: ATPase, family [Spirosoma sp.]|nr:ATPase, family [Spirosoma sp.]
MPNEFDFDALKKLRDSLVAIRLRQVDSLSVYLSKDGLGFCHQIEKPAKASLASTATCISSLVRSGRLGDVFDVAQAGAVAADLVTKTASAGLVEGNPFSVAFVVEGVLDLLDAFPQMAGAAEIRGRLNSEYLPKLTASIKSSGDADPVGSVRIEPYPASAYLTQLVFRVLKRAGACTPATSTSAHRWARTEINKQVALIGAKSRIADPLQLAYALIVAVTSTADRQTSPEDKEIFAHALQLFFEQQLDDGSWPLSRPMFHYKMVGNAYSFEYELLAQLVGCAPLRDGLIAYLGHLERAVLLAERTSYELDPEKPGSKSAWASGHHPQLLGPESWSTASVYDFAHTMDRLVAEAVRQALFNELGEIYKSPPGVAVTPPASGIGKFADDFLDADLHFNGEVRSLRTTLAESFVFPIAREAGRVTRGLPLGEDTPMSAILFGPPGTSKTDLAKIISRYLNWPLLPVDPSYLVQRGLDQVQAMANRLFGLLRTVEEVVVLLDEFDEMGRDRAGNENLLSRFITTAMLPKLAAINKERKIVFLLATNYVSGFDAAFSRGGRFDMVLQIMPPTVAAKRSFGPWKEVLARALPETGEDATATREIELGELTFLETKKLVRTLATLNDEGEIASAFAAEAKARTMQKENDSSPRRSGQTPDSGTDETTPPAKRTWATTCVDERAQIRIPPVVAATPAVPVAEKPKAASRAAGGRKTTAAKAVQKPK